MRHTTQILIKWMNLNKNKFKSKLHSMGVTPIVANSIFSTKGVEGLRNAIKAKLGTNESKEIDSFISNVKKHLLKNQIKNSPQKKLKQN
jgi:hypothetical protein